MATSLLSLERCPAVPWRGPDTIPSPRTASHGIPAIEADGEETGASPGYIGVPGLSHRAWRALREQAGDIIAARRRSECGPDGSPISRFNG